MPLTGNAIHVENMAKLQKTFKFGKWKSIYNSEGDYAGVELSFKTSLTVSTSIRPSLFRKDCPPIVIPRGRRFRQEIRDH